MAKIKKKGKSKGKKQKNRKNRINRVIKEGIIQGNIRGYAFLVNVKGCEEEFFIPHHDLNGAMHGDRVLAETTYGVGEKTTARVLKILERKVKQIVGTYVAMRNCGKVIPDDDRYFANIYIPSVRGIRVKTGDKVICKIMLFPKKRRPEGIVTEILGRQGNVKTELKSIYFSYRLPESFPKEVLMQAENYKDQLTQQDIANRRDFRDKMIFTIDGEDARDFDDAVSVEKEKNIYILGVHIADVSEYVKQNDDIDKEAFERGTSVYFPEQVIPMLPERLCNGLCSLKENEDRLTLSCIMKIDREGNVIDNEIVSSVIKSKRRFTYTTVQKIIDGDKSARNDNKCFVEDILLMKELADILSQKRKQKGSIDLEVRESTITVENGKIDVIVTEKDGAHGLIEEFMIAANCAVAERFACLQLPFVYRVHDKPTEERLEKFYVFLDGLGIKYRRNREEISPIDFQKVLKDAENSPAFSVINRVMLRTMQKAKYSTETEGHFGLAEKYYCHFTSPIRRYPDLAIHRIIKDCLKNGTKNIEEKYCHFVEEASIHSSEKEKNAEEAERAVDNLYKALYIKDYIGCKFNGVVSGVVSTGIFVELENGVEGFVPIEMLGGEKFECDRKSFTLSNGKTSYRLGQQVKIVVDEVDITSRQINFSLCDDKRRNNLAKNKKV